MAKYYENAWRLYSNQLQRIYIYSFSIMYSMGGHVVLNARFGCDAFSLMVNTVGNFTSQQRRYMIWQYDTGLESEAIDCLNYVLVDIDDDAFVPSNRMHYY
eukprot:205014_1